MAKCVTALHAVFTVAKAEILKLLKQDSFRRYLNSECWEEFVKAALRNEGTAELIPGICRITPRENRVTGVLLLPNGDQYVGETQDGLYEGSCLRNEMEIKETTRPRCVSLSRWRQI